MLLLTILQLINPILGMLQIQQMQNNNEFIEMAIKEHQLVIDPQDIKLFKGMVEEFGRY